MYCRYHTVLSWTERAMRWVMPVDMDLNVEGTHLPDNFANAVDWAQQLDLEAVAGCVRR